MADDEKCHVFQPLNARPSKRRRVEPDATWEIRENVYRDLWNQQRDKIQTVLDAANHATVDEILAFIEDSLQNEELVPDQTPIPAGFVLAGPDTTSHSAFFEQLADGLSDQASTRVFVSLNSSECGASLKGLLKSLVRGIVGDEDDLTVNNGTTKLLEYDLAILVARMKEGSKEGLVLALQDSEAFPSQVLMELIDLLGYVHLSLLCETDILVLGWIVCQ
jgi:Origin recognition complex (ORC) subunit 3 N-terminus